MNVKERLKTAFNINRIIPRLIATWFFMAFILLIKYNFNYSELSFAQDISIILIAVLIIVIFVILSVPAFFLNKFHTDSWAMVISGFLMLSHVILEGTTGSSGILPAFIYSIILAFIYVYFVNKNKELLEKLSISKTITIIIVSIIGFLFMTFMSMGMIAKYKSYGCPNFDFGIFAQVFYNLKAHLTPDPTCERNKLLSHFAVHVSPIFYIALPIYYLFPYAETVQFIQCLFVMAGLIPFTMIMFNHKMKNSTIIAFAFIYSMFPALTTSGFYDFHENCFLVLPLLFLFYFTEKKNYIGMGIFGILTLMVKEDASIYVLVFAVYVLVNSKTWKDYLSGGIMAVVPLIYFFTITSILNKSGDGAMYYRYGNLIYESGAGMIGAFKTIIINPGLALKTLFTTSTPGYLKLIYFLELLTPICFLPMMIKKPSRLILLAPILLNLLTNYGYQYNITFQYSYGISAFLLYSTILNFEDLQDANKGKAVAIMLAFTTCLYLDLAYPTLMSHINTYNTYKATYDLDDEILSTIPSDASVNANGFFLPHLASRDVIYETYYHKAVDDVDFVVLHTTDSTDNELYTKYLEMGYIEVTNENSIVILKSPNYNG